MKPIVIILNGYPLSGKDDFCEFAAEKYNCINHSTVDTVKGFALKMGWDGIKNAWSRAMLKEFKDFYDKWFNGPFKEIVKVVNYHVKYNDWCRTNPKKFIFIHIRERKNILITKNWCQENDISCYAIFIDREIIKGNQSNRADAEVANFTYDYIITNNSSLKLYKKTVIDFLETHFK